jgi:GT2 family glycosyltransferase
MIRTSIIIVSYNQTAMLKRCLESLIQYVDLSLNEIFVVDNHSADDGIRKLSDQFPRVRFLFLEKNIGFGKANNHAAFNFAKGKYLLLLNSDAYLLEPIIEPMVRYLEQHQSVKIVGPRLVNPDKTLQSSTHGYPSIAKECLRLLPGIKYLLHHRRISTLCWLPIQTLFRSNILSHVDSYRPEIQEVEEVTGACFLIEKEAFCHLKGFDPHYFMYLEEADLCLRVRRLGGTIVYYPLVAAGHELHGSSNEAPVEKVLLLYRQRCYSLIYFFRKNYGAARTARLRFALSICLLIRIVLEFPVSLFHPHVHRSLVKDMAFLKICILNSNTGPGGIDG